MKFGAGKAGAITSLWLYWPAPSYGVCRRTGGKKLPQIKRPQLTRGLRQLLPQRTWPKTELGDWLHATQRRNQQAKQAHATRRRVKQSIAIEQCACT